MKREAKYKTKTKNSRFCSQFTNYIGNIPELNRDIQVGQNTTCGDGSVGKFKRKPQCKYSVIRERILVTDKRRDIRKNNSGKGCGARTCRNPRVELSACIVVFSHVGRCLFVRISALLAKSDFHFHPA